MTRRSTRARRRRNRAPDPRDATESARTRRNRAITWAVAIAVIGVIAFFPVALLTDRPAFCATCHGMRPFVSAWREGGHKDVWCIDCHVEKGLPSRFAHKFVALREVYAQVFTRATYPQYHAVVPDARCLGCHPEIPRLDKTPTSTFSHVTHLNKNMPCQKCHASTGHKVTFQSLAVAGVLNTTNAPSGLTYVGEEFRTTTGTPSALAGHRPVPCSQCHDQKDLPCSFCHATPTGHYGPDCAACHRPNVPFLDFRHPPTGEHDYRSRPCVKCHPNGYATAYCTCHNGKPPEDD